MSRWLLLALLLAGCTTTATYWSPDGQRLAQCTRHAGTPGWGWLGLLTSPVYAAAELHAGETYAACKTRLERAGYVRE
jgi:hypothetical protein